MRGRRAGRGLGVALAFAISLYSFSIRSGGVPTGARIPYQTLASNPGWPIASAMVGTFGNSFIRSVEPTASSLSVPALMCVAPAG